jgi:hypothetical protein
MRALGHADAGGGVGVAALARSIDAFRVARREFAARVLADVLERVDHRQVSVRELFAAFDADGSGALETAEFRAAMRQIGIGLSEADVEEVSPRPRPGPCHPAPLAPADGGAPQLPTHVPRSHHPPPPPVGPGR